MIMIKNIILGLHRGGSIHHITAQGNTCQSHGAYWEENTINYHLLGQMGSNHVPGNCL